MENGRRKAIWWAAAVAVLVLAGAAVVTFVLIDSPEAAAGPDGCSAGPGPEQVSAYFDDDADMRAAAEKMRDDDRVAGSDTETKREAWARFKVIFADQPELVKLGRPEAMPASLWLVPAEDTSAADLAKRMRNELPAADSVTTVPCPMPTTRAPTPSS